MIAKAVSSATIIMMWAGGLPAADSLSLPSQESAQVMETGGDGWVGGIGAGAAVVLLHAQHL